MELENSRCEHDNSLDTNAGRRKTTVMGHRPLSLEEAYGLPKTGLGKNMVRSQSDFTQIAFGTTQNILLNRTPTISQKNEPRNFMSSKLSIDHIGSQANENSPSPRRAKRHSIVVDIEEVNDPDDEGQNDFSSGRKLLTFSPAP